MTRALFAYRPDGARNLLLCCKADRQQEHLDAYLMSGVRRLVYGLMGRDADFPSFEEYARDIRNRRPVSHDRRTSFEIARDLITALEA